MVAKKSKKIKRLVLKIKSLEEAKPTRPKRSEKPVKVLIKKTKQKPPSLTKPIEPAAYKARIKVIGIGGGGSSIVSEIALEVKKVGFVVANTDFQVLQEATKGVKHFQFGKSITQGLGTGMNPELGEQAAESDKEKIKELLKETDFCVLISCLSGGTGSGASPVFAKILKNLKILTLGIFTLPFEFEGGKKAQIAKDSLEKLRPNLNALVIIPNQKIFQIIDKNTPLKEAFSIINKTIAESLEGLITLMDSPGLIHVDFATLETNLAGRGKLAYFNTVETESPNQIEELTKRLLSNSLFPYSVQGVKEILFNIDGGLNLNMDQVEQIGKTISSSINPQARVAFGITQNKKEGIKITLLANGCKWEEWETRKKPKEENKKKRTLITKIRDSNPPTASSHSPSGEWAPNPKEKARKKKEKKPLELSKIQQPGVPQIPTEDYSPSTTLPAEGEVPKPEKVKITVRKKTLEAQKTIQKEEKKILAQERKWETPAFLRQKPTQGEEKMSQ